MAVVSDPGGTASVAYCCGDVTIATLSTGGNNTQATAPAIVRYSSYTVVSVSSGGTPAGQGVKLPADAEIGDVVEVYEMPSPSYGPFRVWPQSGGTISQQAVDTNITVQGFGARFRFLGSGAWGVVNG